MRIKPFLFYVKSRYKKEFIKNKKETYQVDMLVSILRYLRKDAKVKLWSEIEDRHFNNKIKDNRTAKEIEKDVLDKFKNWAS